VVPAADSPHAATVIRSLGRRGIHTIAAYEQPTPAFSSRYCDETQILTSPEANVQGYKADLLELATRDDVCAVFPMREVDAYVLAKHRSEFEAAVAPLWAPLDTLRTVHDRLELVAAAREASVGAPETRLLEDAHDWNVKRVVKARYPLLTEEYVDGHSEQGASEPNTVRYLDAGDEPSGDALRAEMGHTPVVQEFVPGEEYAFWALYEHGERVASCQKHQVRGDSYAGGTSVYRRTVDIPALEAAGRDLLEHLDWHGFASVQFKRDDRTGEFKLLEINPRVWVSIACPVLAGVEFPYYFWQLSNGGEVSVPADYETGIGTHRIGGEMMYLSSILRAEEDTFVDAPPLSEAVRNVLASIYRQPHFDYLDPDDVQPFVQDLAGWLARQVDESVGHLLSRSGESDD
jgi:predicted ATP-grasp superfamily ATP-dependent carboligase